MEITKLTLQNVKSYGRDEARVAFLPGVNLIWGENGSGKTTILEAIGFALFGALDYTKDQFRREGESEGEIVLSFLGRDNRPYQLVRKVGSGSSYIFDPTIEKRLTRRQEDTEHWLSDEMGVELGDYAKALFHNAIGVPQGGMTGIFLETAQPRKTVFDELLRVTEYRTAYDELARSDRHLRESLSAQRERAAGLMGGLERLPAVWNQVSDLEARTASARSELVGARANQEALKATVAVLDASKVMVETLARALTAAEHALETTQAQMNGARDALLQAGQAALVVTESMAGHLVYRNALSRRDELSRKLGERDRERTKLTGIEKSLTEVKTGLSGIGADLDRVVQAEVRLIELAPSVKRQAQLEADVAAAQQQVLDCQHAVDEAAKAHSRAAQLAADLAGVQAKLRERAAYEERLASLTQRREDLISQIAAIDEELRPLQSLRPTEDAAWRQAEHKVQELANAEKRVAEETTVLDRQQVRLVKAEAALTERMEIEQQLADISAELLQRQTKQAAAQAEFEQCGQSLNLLDERLSVLRGADAAECPVCKSQLDDDRARHLEGEFAQEHQGLSERRDAAHEAKTSAKQEMGRLTRQQEMLQRSLTALAAPAQVEEARQGLAEQQRKIETWRKQIEALAGARERAAEAKQILDHLDARIAELAGQREALEQARDRVDSERDRANRHVATLPLPSRAEELASQIDQTNHEGNEWAQRANALSEAPAALAQTQRSLGELGDPRTQQAKQQSIAERRDELEREQCQVHLRLAALLEQQSAQQVALEPFGTLDADLAQVAAEMEQHATDDRRYTANEQLASTRDARQRALDELHVLAEKRETERVRAAERHLEAVRCYDAVDHQRVQAKIEEIAKTIIQLDTKLAEWGQQLVALQAEIGRLLEQQRSLEAAQGEVKRLDRLAEVFKFVRQSIKDAGPQVVRRRVEVISYQANHIFQDILDDPALTINWDDTYAINARCKGEQRAFKQLSGGEQMAAAIAVRLALLMQMSDVRILFLDEPTANLDDKRRDKLADRITQMEGLQQIFVITHDDAFQRDTHHVIHVVKDHGLSRIEER
jgi:exonuclease SbcC